MTYDAETDPYLYIRSKYDAGQALSTRDLDTLFAHIERLRGTSESDEREPVQPQTFLYYVSYAYPYSDGGTGLGAGVVAMSTEVVLSIVGLHELTQALRQVVGQPTAIVLNWWLLDD